MGSGTRGAATLALQAAWTRTVKPSEGLQLDNPPWSDRPSTAPEVGVAPESTACRTSASRLLDRQTQAVADSIVISCRRDAPSQTRARQTGPAISLPRDG